MHFHSTICKELSDQEIVKKAQVDIDYYACLVIQYEKRLMAYIRKVSQISQEEAEDILQEAFIKIWKNLLSFDTSMKLENWIFRIVHNETISFLRKKTSFGKTKTVELKDEFVSASEENEKNNVELENLPAIITRILPLLKLEYRDVLILKYIEEKSYEEISDILKIPEGTVAIRLNRAKKAFKKLAENSFDYSILNNI